MNKVVVKVLRVMFLFVCILIIAGIYSINVKADSVLTIPVPNQNGNKQVTLSLRIPPHTEPIERQESRPKLQSKKSYIVWDSNPLPQIDPNDELLSILRNFQKKGWVTSLSPQQVIRSKNVSKLFAVRALQHIVDNVLKIPLAPNYRYVIQNCNLTTSDIEDLRRMVKRFELDLIKLGSNANLCDKDLLMIQESFKEARQGVLKVIRVESAKDGSTLIHLSVD